MGKKYALGDEILRCKIPFAYVVNQEIVLTTCDQCLKRTPTDANSGLNEFLRCSGCKYVRYCSKRCQMAAWNSGHREECDYLRRVRPKIPPDTVRLLARIILRLRCGGGHDAAEIPDGTKRCFHDLMSNEKALIRESPIRVEAFNTYLHVLQQCFPPNAAPSNKNVLPVELPSKPELLEIFGRILTNSFNIMDDEYQSIGIGLYLAASVFDHSCDPNTAIIFKGKELIARYIGNQSGNIADSTEFSDLRISYTNLLNTTKQRQKELREQYYFDCECIKCFRDNKFGNPQVASNLKHQDIELAKEGSLFCINCKNYIAISQISLPELVCQNCKSIVPFDHIQRHKKCAADFVSYVEKNTGGHPEPLTQYGNEFFEEMYGLFHPCDRNYLTILEHVYEQKVSEASSCSDEKSLQHWNDAMKIGDEILLGYRTVYPPYDVNTALMALKLGKIASYMENNTKARENLETAKSILLITHGETHPLYANTLSSLFHELNLHELTSPYPKSQDNEKLKLNHRPINNQEPDGDFGNDRFEDITNQIDPSGDGHCSMIEG